MSKKEATIYDIAKELNLSASTVSRALNENKSIKPATIERVLNYAHKIGYQSNTFASNLRTRDTKTIGVIVPKLDSNFISRCLAGAESVASLKGYNLIISQSFESVEKEIEIAKTMFKKRVDGLLVSMALNSRSVSHFNSFFNKGIPLLFFDRTPGTIESPSYLIDNVLAAYTATKHLIENNCKNLVFLNINSNCLVYRQRLEGFKKAVNEASQPLIGETIFLEKLDLDSGKQAAKIIAGSASGIDGVFAANDQTAVGCILGLQEMGIRVPEDVSVVGFNNDPVCEIISPALTSVNYPAYDLGKVMTNHLLEHIFGNSTITLTNQTILKSELIVRKSSVRKL